MIQLLIYLISAMLVVIGAVAFIAALNIKGRFRALVACVAACVPVGIGFWLFQSAGLKVGDLDPLLQKASQEIQEMFKGLQETQSVRKEFQDLLR